MHVPVFCFIMASCNKEPGAINPAPVGNTGMNQVQPATPSNQKTFAYAINPDRWLDYPYIGHDGDDSENRMFLQLDRPILGKAYYKGSGNIKSVIVKSGSGKLFTAPLWVSVGLSDSGYVYAIGNTGVTNQFSLWWIQKPPYVEQPNADSVFITLRW